MSAPLRIQAVADQTGVQAETLRAWERRYGVPAPRRTASAYRIYDAADVAEIVEMRDLVAQGVRAAEAASVVSGRRSERAAVPYDSEIGRRSAIDRIVDATLRFDSVGLDVELAAAELLGEGAFDRVMAPALVRIGELWASGALSVAHEHFASDRIASLLRTHLRVASPATDMGKVVLLACFDEDQHGISLLAVALRFASWGYRPVVLGARTPPEALGHAVRAVRPALVALSTTIATPDRSTRALVRAYARAIGDVPWIVGGAAAEKLGATIEAEGGIVARTPIVDLHKILRGLRTREDTPLTRPRRRS